MINIRIETDNAAFGDGCKQIEIARILRDIANRVESGGMGTSGEYTQQIRDINGNSVGSFEVF